MAWNDDPKVRKAAEVAKEWGKDQVIILGIDQEAETLEVVTYGRTKELCDAAKFLGDKLFEAVIGDKL